MLRTVAVSQEVDALSRDSDWFSLIWDFAFICCCLAHVPVIVDEVDRRP
jgi:hypothetical protein